MPDSIEEYFRSQLDWMEGYEAPDIKEASLLQLDNVPLIDQARMVKYNLRIRREIKKGDPSLGPTWWVLDHDKGFDDIAQKAGDSLALMKEKLEIYPFQDMSHADRLFLLRFEVTNYGATARYPEAIFADPSKTGLWLHFLAGFPIDCVEMLVLIASMGSIAKAGEKSKVLVMPGKNKPYAPVPTGNLFKWPEADKVLLNLTALPTVKVGKIFAPNLREEPRPNSAHWWFGVNLVDDVATDEDPTKGKKWPVPGEFIGLGCRLFPGEPWGRQKSNPFVYSGNWVDTVYYTTGVIKEVIPPPKDGKPFPGNTYKVQWRATEEYPDGLIAEARATDFAEYRVDDMVTILKNVKTEKTSQLWKDEDMTKWGGMWQICPITFYYLEAFYPNKPT